MKKIDKNPREIFFEAIQQETPEKLRDYLDTACADDLELRAKVDELLAAHAQAGRFLGGFDDSIETHADTFDAKFSDEQIGPYKLLEIIGEGGMGTVYMARQTEPVKRRVALKLIKAGMDTQQVIARFEAERQALALMDHPNIAKVLDAGTTESGRPYFVMELVKGKPITKFCDEQKLDLDSRLKLFQQVCQAVQHAHQKGIIHRDIKPSNVLVAMYDDKPVPKVIDFGVAKATGDKLTEKTMFTRFGQIVGTLEYMSPEQAQFNNLDIDTRSDIYSLGAILYELLAGEPPFERKKIRSQALDETLRMIREDEPTRPSTKFSNTPKSAQVASSRKSTVDKLGSILRGELDWIVMKALEKDRTGRYETANGLAADIHRYLHDEPVSATPPSTAYRFRKFASRNKVVLAFVALTLIFLVTGVGGLGISNYQLNERDREVRAALKSASANLSLARENEERALLEAEIAEETNLFLNSILGSTDPHNEPDRTLQVSEVLDRALVEIETTFQGKPLIEAESRKVIAKALRNLGRIEEMEKQLQRVHDIYVAEYGPQDRKTLDVAVSLHWVLHDRGQYLPCLTRLESHLAELRQQFGNEDRLVLNTWAMCCDLMNHLGRSRIAEQQYREIIAIGERVFGKDDAVVLDTKQRLSQVIGPQNRKSEAVELLEDVIVGRTCTLGEHHPKTLYSQHERAKLLWAQGKYPQAENLIRDVIEGQKIALGESHRNTQASIRGLAQILHSQGRYSDALAILDDAISSLVIHRGETDRHTQFARVQKANFLTDAGQYEEALRLTRELLKQIENGPAATDLVLSAKDAHLDALVGLSKIPEAEAAARELVDNYERFRGSEHRGTLESKRRLASLLHQQGFHSQAEEILEEVLITLRAVFGEEFTGTLNCQYVLANVKQHLGKTQQAIALLKTVLRIREKRLRPTHLGILEVKASLGRAHWQLLQLENSIPLFEDVVKAYHQELSASHPSTLFAEINLAHNYKDANRLDDAIAQLTDTLSRARLPAPRAAAIFALIDAYVLNGQIEDARQHIPEFLEIIESKLPKTQRAFYHVLLSKNYFFEINEFSRGEQYLLDAIAIRKEIGNQKEIDSDEFMDAKVTFYLGEALLGQQKFEEAEPLLQKGYDGVLDHDIVMRKSFTASFQREVERVVALYRSADAVAPGEGFDDKAAEWEQKLEEFLALSKVDN